MESKKLTVCQLPVFEGNEAQMLEVFQNSCILLSNEFSPLSNKFTFIDVVKASNINISRYNKFRHNRHLDIYIAFWISFLDVVVKGISPDSYKYKTVEDFTDTYKETKNLSFQESVNLFKTANWMNILLMKAKSKRIKTIAIEVSLIVICCVYSLIHVLCRLFLN